MNQTLKLIGTIGRTIELVIRWYSTINILTIIITMPIVLMSIINEGTILQHDATTVMNWYAFYLTISICSWIIYLLQTKIIIKTKYFKKIKNERDWRNWK